LPSTISTHRGGRETLSIGKAGSCVNTNKEVQIYRYVTESSFDAYMWQTLETEARFIQQVMRGQTSVRTAEDLDSGALTYAEIKAIARATRLWSRRSRSIQKFASSISYARFT